MNMNHLLPPSLTLTLLPPPCVAMGAQTRSLCYCLPPNNPFPDAKWSLNITDSKLSSRFSWLGRQKKWRKEIKQAQWKQIAAVLTLGELITAKTQPVSGLRQSARRGIVPSANWNVRWRRVPAQSKCVFMSACRRCLTCTLTMFPLIMPWLIHCCASVGVDIEDSVTIEEKRMIESQK